VNQGHRFSIIIPTLQEGKLLFNTLRQFTAEIRHKFNIEIIVSDGGSTDDTISIAQSYANRVVQKEAGSKQNISIGRNEGAKIATGEILIFINADVVIEDINKFFLTLSDVFGDNTIIAATCNVNIYPEEQTIKDWIFHNCFNGYFWILNLIGIGMGRGECHVVRREVFEKLNGYNNKLAAGEDFEFFMRLKKVGKVKFIRNLTVYESPRRFRRYGYFWITLQWFLNSVSVLFFKHSFVDNWEPIR